MPLHSPSGLSFEKPFGETLAMTENLSLKLIDFVVKFVDENTGDVTVMMSPSFISPLVCIMHVDV